MKKEMLRVEIVVFDDGTLNVKEKFSDALVEVARTPMLLGTLEYVKLTSLKRKEGKRQP